ncbi:uncharacterized protein BX664DRAFT_115493 [Halteromyces radiatus]|uniref:uncharacterized protein n=1 Tax=Halteromyces radiatus TaxID=101107 RepID=UPI0022205EB1|nr:uncharacterized protein BX664DRAFT_115493 [Halteromyces radiatus]KAI8093854.1 hypothetical protein BX664DRAFT_115493 [Halteromyces radiatus]
MDPYSNPYGYSPRGSQRPYRPNYNRPPQYANMSYNGYATRPHTAGPTGISPPPAPSLDRNKLNTLFVGAIPVGVNDEGIEQLLKTCGVLLEWKRVKDQSGNPKGFGFATYNNPDSVLRALRVLGGEEGYTGVTLKAQDGNALEKKLVVKADDNVRKNLDQYKSSKEPALLAVEKEQDARVLETVESIVQSICSGKTIDSTIDNTTTHETIENNDSMEDTLSKDLAFLRERATRSEAQQENHHRTEDRRQPDHRRRRQEFVRGQSEQLSMEEYDVELERDDEEAERRRQEKHQKEMLAIFRQREKRFEQLEVTQLHDYERNLKREKEDQERRIEDKAYWAKRLAEWDDDIEMKNEECDYYNDRSRWRKARSAIRRREEERDEKDRRLEAAKRSDEASQKMTSTLSNESNTTEPTPLPMTDKPAVVLQMKPIAPTKIKAVPTKRASGLGGDDEDDEEVRKRRVLIPLDYSGIEEDTTMEEGQPASEEERNQKIKDLIRSIPSSEDELWQWPLRWEVLNDDLITEKLGPFVNKKIIELVGVEEEELETFILDSIKKHTPPLDLIKELEMTLDEDALVFVMKLWRTIIFETERVARHL